jgi:hypothetical protein
MVIFELLLGIAHHHPGNSTLHNRGRLLNFNNVIMFMRNRY